MTILVDIDSTLTNFGEVWLHYLNMIYNTKYRQENITSWDWPEKVFDEPWEPLNERKFWEEVKVNEDAKCVISEWTRYNRHKVYLVTASEYTDTLGLKIRSTVNQFPPNVLTTHNVLIAHDKSLIDGDVIIDDNPENLKNGKCKYRLLYNQPWNRDQDGMFVRVNDWADIQETVSQIILSK